MNAPGRAWPRYGVCFTLVLALHAGAGWLLARSHPLPLPRPSPEAMMLELPPEPTAPEPTPVVEPTPQPVAPAEPEPPPPLSPPPEPPPPIPVEPVPAVPAPEVVLPPPSPPPRRPVRPTTRSTAHPRPVVVPNEAPPPPPAAIAAPPPQAAALAAAASSNAVPNWRSEMVGRLQRAKRYPDAARARDEQGVATVTFTIDRSGYVLAAQLVRSSGSAALDTEAVAMVHRAEPLPAVPAEMPGATITLTMPVSFSLR